MDQALNSIIGPWSQLGIVGAVVVALGWANILQWRRNEMMQKVIDALHEARRLDAEKNTDKYVDILVKNLDTNNRMADGMEAFERVVDMVKVRT